MANFNVYGTPWEPDEPYEVSIARIKALAARAGTPGHNEYGQALHACHGYRHDAHYWAWAASGRKNG
jgi:hypothetical protein